MTFNFRISKQLAAHTGSVYLSDSNIIHSIFTAFDFEFPGIVRSEIIDCVYEIKT